MSSAPLHILEKKVLKALEGRSAATIDDISKVAGIGQDQTRRALEWLKEKSLVQVSYQTISEVALRSEGKKVAMQGLPERRIISSMKKPTPLQELAKISGLEGGEFSAALGAAKAFGWIEVKKEGNATIVSIKNTPETTPEEELLSRLLASPLNSQLLTAEEKKALSNLAKRPNFILEKTAQIPSVQLTSTGANVVAQVIIENEIDALTPEVLVSGKWKDAAFRSINVSASAPPIYPGKRHPLQQFIDEVREIFTSIGFEEIEGSLVQPCFWNFDALFTPQDHPSREIQDTFYIAGHASKNPADNQTIKKVSTTHVDGGETGSKGWGYQWKLEEAERTVLRTHTTCLTVRYLADNKPEDARVFSIGRVFRNEKVSYKHIVEFHQVEGILVGKEVTLRDIMGLLGQFYQKLGFQKIKFWPSYFPYTEPSLQSMVYFEKLNKWLELGGMGIFRPEVTLPVGVKNPVLAWGLGLERLVMLRYGMEDIREIYGNNLGWLRRVALRQ